jgi:hypothetical protein
VVVRNTTFGAAPRRQPTGQPVSNRRQYYIALDTPGTELRLPALPTFHPSWRMLSFALAMAALGAAFTMLFSPFFKVGALEVKGLNRLTQSNIESVVDLQNYSIVEVNAADIKKSLLATFPDLAAVSVAVGLPDSVTLTIQERVPVMVWKQGDDTLWVDASGVIYPPRGEAGDLLTINATDPPPHAFTPDLNADNSSGQGAAAVNNIPAGTANVDTINHPALRKIDMAFFDVAQKLVTRLPASTPLAYSALHGLGWQDPNGYAVYIGHDMTDFEVKFTLAERIALELGGRGITPKIIDVEFPNAPFYRMEQ